MLARIVVAIAALLLVYTFAQPLVALLLGWLVPPPPDAAWYSFDSFRILRDFSFETSAWESHVMELLPTALAFALSMGAAVLLYQRRIPGMLFLGLLVGVIAANLLAAFLMQGQYRHLWYETTLDGFRLTGAPGGQTRALTTAELPVLLAYVKGCNQIDNPHLYRLFDRVSGRPQAWYLESPGGTYTFYDSPCYDPRIGIRLPRVNQQVFAAWVAQRSGAAPARDASRRPAVAATRQPASTPTGQPEVSAADLAGFYIGSLVHPDTRRETVTLNIQWPKDGVFSYVMNSATHQLEGKFTCITWPCTVSVGDSFRFVPARTPDGRILLTSGTAEKGTTIVSLRKRK